MESPEKLRLSLEEQTVAEEVRTPAQGSVEPGSATPSSTTASTPQSPVDEIPDVQDPKHPHPAPGVVRISAEAAYYRMRRIFHPRGPRPKHTVSQELTKQWDKGGKSRKALEQIFQSVGYSPERGCKTTRGL